MNSPTPTCIEEPQLSRRVAAMAAIGETPWRLQDGALAIDLAFVAFAHAFALMSAVALEAERMQHHPEWSNVYNRLSIRLRTHDAGGVTELDFALADAISKHASAYLTKPA